MGQLTGGGPRPVQRGIDPDLGVIKGQFLAGLYRWGGLQTSILRDLFRPELPEDYWDGARAYEQTL
jgi:hypothetical protein